MKLYPHQPEGIEFLRSRAKAYLADGCGLGKTVQACVAARELFSGLDGLRDFAIVLVTCPASAVENWRREWVRHGPLAGATLIVVSCDSLASWLAVNPGRSFDLLIGDEAHRFKTPSARRSKAFYKIARRARRVWLLSATPMPNHPGELWLPVKHLWPELALEHGVRTGVDWMRRYCYTYSTPYGDKPYKVKNGPELRELLKKIMLRRTHVEGLPTLRVDVSLLPRNRAFADALDARGIDPGRLQDEIDGAEHVASVRRLLGTYKAPLIADIVARELRDGEYAKVVVLAHHKDTLLRLARTLKPFGLRGIHGGTPVARRQEAIDQFNHDSGVRVFLGQQQAAGESINLQAASEVVLVEPSWVPDANWQAIKRIHRIGQDSACRARMFAVAGSLDETVMETLARKTRMQADVGLTSEEAE